jgi:hypothetical protein
MGHSPQPLLFTRLLMYHQWVPRGARFWLIVLFAMLYQLTGGVYLAAISQMNGELAFINEDVTLASYCSLIGLNIIFPVLFRWKFYFFTRQMFFVSATGSMICALIAMYVTTPWLFWIVCFLAGYFKMMGMFCCISNVQLNFTPTRDFRVFLPVIYILVCSAIQISGVMTSLLAYFYNWRMIYVVVVGMMLFIDCIAYFLMKPDHRPGPFIPLKGIDWLGHLLWSVTCCVGAWIFTFGEHYDWWDSIEIWRGTWIFLALLVVTLWESHIKQEGAFIPIKAFSYGRTWVLMGLLLGMGLMQTSVHVLQPVYVNAVAHYDYLTSVRFNYPELAGVIMGAILAYYALRRLQWSARVYFFFCFLLVTLYLSASYFLIHPDTEAWLFDIPLFAFGVAEVMMETGVTYWLSQAIPFPHFFINITIVGFVRCGLGTSAVGALTERLFAWSTAKNAALNAAALDGFNPIGNGFDWAQYLGSQTIITSLRECYGYLIIFGIIMMTLVLCSNFKPTVTRIVPQMGSVARWLRHPATSPDPSLH